LGWAYYRLGNMEEAVKQLERAVELKPEDPTINGHLGDAYWRGGRQLEARFPWWPPRGPQAAPPGPGKDADTPEYKIPRRTTPPPRRRNTRSPTAAEADGAGQTHPATS